MLLRAAPGAAPARRRAVPALMGLNVLGPRKTRAVARATGLDVVHAVVQSHGDAGRAVWFTTRDHQHGVLDRHTGEWQTVIRQPADPQQWACRQSSCHALFGPDGELAYVAEPDPPLDLRWPR